MGKLDVHMADPKILRISEVVQAMQTPDIALVRTRHLCLWRPGQSGTPSLTSFSALKQDIEQIKRVF